jgi:threonine dehydrogenase-like Zn-dependent dehydrogenase
MQPSRVGAAALPRRARAAVLPEFGAPLEIRELPMPELEPGALLVKVEVATICGSDVHIAQGKLGIYDFPLPVVLGHEFVGEVVAIGNGADRDSVGTDLAIGDRVVWEHESCGRCAECTLLGQSHLCRNKRVYGLLNCEEFPYLVGGYAEYCYVFPRSGRLKVPLGLEPEWVSAASCAARTVMAGFERLGRIAPWESVVIQGAGPLGLFATVVAHRAGAKRVIVVGAPEPRLALARDYGADHVVTIEGTTREDRQALVRELTAGEGADVVMEFSGGRGALGEAVGFTRPSGRIVVVGQVGPDEEAITASMITKKGIDIRGSFSAGIAHYWQALELLSLARADVDWGAMISGRYTLDQADLALQRMAAHTEIKPAIYPHGLH